jgi:2-hydroxychromene-2-carboxylate isomerase
MTRVQFLFDFGSPNAYMSHKVIPDIEARTGATFEYVPVLLGGVFKLTNNKPPMIAFGGIKNKMEYEQLEMRRFIARHKLSKFQFNPNFPVNTLAIMRAATAAQMAGELPRYVGAVFGFTWETGRKMDDPETIRASLAEAGLDADRLIAAAQTPEVKDQLMRNTSEAVDRGVFGIPSFFVGNELFFGKDRLRDVEEEIVRAKVAA